VSDQPRDQHDAVDAADDDAQPSAGSHDPWAPPPEGSQAGQRQAPPHRVWRAPTPQRPAGPSPGRTRPARSPDAPAAGQSGTYALVLGVLGLLAFRDPVIGMILGVGAVVLGAWGVLEARGTRTFSSAAVAGLALGLAVAALAALGLVASMIPSERDYRSCLEGALTHTAVAACDQANSNRTRWNVP